MKSFIKTYIIGILYISLLASCGSLVEGLNENPNSPTSSPYNFVLTGAEVGAIMLHEGETARKANIFSGHLEGIDRQHLGFSEYIVSSGDFDSQWDDAYVHAIRNALVAEELAIEEDRTGIATGISKVLQALSFGTTTSLYGDIPFDEAGFIEFENPAFNAQADVYKKLQTLLDDAITELQSGEGRLVSNTDFYFEGDANPWVEVAYTLKARYYLHTGNYAEAYQAATIGISSNDNSMLVPHVQAQPGSNLYNQFFAVARPNDIKISDFFEGMMNPSSGDYRGNAKTDETARYNNYFRTNNSGVTVNTNGYMSAEAPFPLVSYAENLLILAETGLRSNDFNTGLSHLNEFRTFMRSGGYLYNVDETSNGLVYDDYVTNDFQSGGIANTDNLSQDDALLKEILEERYITLFGQIEAFSDTRRTYDEQNLRVQVPPNTGDELPQRFLYPQSEIDRNDNTPSPIPDFFEKTPINQ
ncbi:SusD/RagB family nutrient-binding outer membrane lipoprotein [Marivirga salinae]|uniref:SusD/RagB family nutrient-binding outer membrane lipoprotein n=1 Tax=Marivirga salinarum TaxID=3059078 RepID=A0AA49GAJ4_9BACT|nr:SusD/RagB family nutrient-binding outer membrane lipoprotein [Marivirga sp. BDSF4-3]WKK74904.2 SusD/RagB family nutrient-binding outer membrane lipoprotein [Marivirga sp. BDSF4-3]